MTSYSSTNKACSLRQPDNVSAYDKTQSTFDTENHEKCQLNTPIYSLQFNQQIGTAHTITVCVRFCLLECKGAECSTKSVITAVKT